MNYLALTIGPIISTLQQARKTKELWVASYLFSHLTKCLVEEINEKGKVLTPHYLNMPNANLFGAGLFPDRLFAEADGLDDAQVELAVENALAKWVVNVLPNEENNISALKFWKKYLRISWAFMPISDLSKENLYDTLTPFLDTAELSPRWFPVEPENNHLIKLFEGVYSTELSKALFQKGAYNGLMEKGLFPSTADIATLELFQKNSTAYNLLRKEAKIEAQKAAETKKKDRSKIDEESDETLSIFYEKVFARESPFKNSASDYHKYFCIVHGDGDNFGETNKRLKTKEDNIHFSKELSGFAVKAANIINEYGGKPIYIGGDDLLFFAPVCSEKGSVFQLIKALDNAFNGTQLDPRPTLSYGLTLSHYKFPLFEARDLSYDQLSLKAKKHIREGKEKDAVAFRLLKHSGSYFEGVFSKKQLAYFLEAENKIRKLDKDLLSSIIYKMGTLENLFKSLLEKQLLNKERLENMFANFFNEPVHRQNPDQLKLIQNLILNIYDHPATIEDSQLDLNSNLFAQLRLLKFITDKPSQNV